MKRRGKNLDIVCWYFLATNNNNITFLIHHGMVLVSDGRGKGRPARIELTKDTLLMQVPFRQDESIEINSEPEGGLRNVTVERQEDGGLGIAVKGGSDSTGEVPVLISKIFKNQAADETGQLFVGDAIVEVNGASLEGKNHDQVVQILRGAGEKVVLGVRHLTQMAAFLRPNAFEVRAVDGSSSGIVHCEDRKALDQWVGHVQNNISALNAKSIKMSNKYLHTSEQIMYLGWICERMPYGIAGDLTVKWEPKFLILKGSDVCLFDTPPLNADDLAKCMCSYKIHESTMKKTKDTDRLDRREHCFWLETGMHSEAKKHYVSVETVVQLAQTEQCWYRATHDAVNVIQSKTFACNFDGRPSGLVIDLHMGFSLYDIPTKRYIWQYRFSQLLSSADDGKMRIHFTFRNSTAPIRKDVKELDCAELYPLIYTIHAFYVAKIIGQDPEFLKATSL